MVSKLFERYISTHTASDMEEVSFATGRSPRPYLRSYGTPARNRRENNLLKSVPNKQLEPKAQPKKEVEKHTMSMAEYSRKLDEAVAMCKRRK